MQHLIQVKRVTIYADQLLESIITSRLGPLGARGYSVVDCRGAGDHPVVQDLAVISSRVRIETIVQEEVAEAIMKFLETTQFSNRSLTACVETVEVSPRGVVS